MEKHPSLKEVMQRLQEKAKGSSLSIENLLDILSGKGKLLVLILLSLPFCQPLQIPGLSTPFGLFIAFIGLRMVFEKGIWLPKQILAKKIDPHFLLKTSKRMFKITEKLNRWIHPRWKWICNHPIMKVINGLLIALLGIFLALPLPIPLSNITAAWAIFLIAFGLLEDNGIFVLIGYAIIAITIAVLAGVTVTLTHFLSH